MNGLNRRSAMTLGLSVVAATPLALLPGPAASEMYAADVGKEIMPGIRQVELGEWPVNFGGYKKAVVNDFVMAPGSAFPEETMKNDMLCHMLEGETASVQDGVAFMATAGLVYSCSTGMVGSDKNEGSIPAVMRVIDLLPA